MKRKHWVVVFVAGFVVALVAAACGGDGSGSAGDTGVGAGTTTGGEGGDLFGTGGGYATLTLDPPEATIVVDNGVSTPVSFKAFQGALEVHPTSWDVDFGTIATVDAKGVVSATNERGGLVIVTAELDGVKATAKVEVFYKKTLNPNNVSPEAQDKLKNATVPDPSVVWAYPYDQTVFPQGLFGPELMWNGSVSGDVFYFKLTGQYVELEVFTLAEPPSRYQLAPADWVAVSESGSSTGKVDVHGARLSGATATVMIDHLWRMARGSLRGTVYYWANNLGRVVRIKPGESAPDDFLANAGVTGCTACHTVSADGLTLVIGGDVATSTYDLLNDQAVLSLGSVGKPVRNWAMPAISPDGRFLVENNAPLPGPPGGADGLWNTFTGQKLGGSGLDGAILDMPAFGPRGHKLAFVGHDGGHDLGVYEFDLVNGVASMPQTMVAAGSDPNLSAICFPSVSPTLQNKELVEKTHIVYHRGVYPGSLDTRFGPGDLYLASADQPGIEWRLEAANGDAYPFAAGDRDRHYNYEPTFAPSATGGYMWIVFTSRRTYGNRLVGSKDTVKQLWVAAIDLDPKPGQDPSHPAFWVPGQDMGTLNMRGYWALDPCVQPGQMCNDDGECCDGKKCENGLCGGAATCAEIGEYCDTSGDCCDPNALCIDGVCQLEQPK
jgi:hypothetical protein